MHRNAESFQDPTLWSRAPLQRSNYEDPLERSSLRSVSSNRGESFGAAVEHHPGHTGRAASNIRLSNKRKQADDCLSQNHESSFWDWKWEIMSMVSSLGLLGGVCMTLAQYHHGQQPEWPFNININSLVSVLTTVLVAQLGFILAEVISQLKWSWFRSPHPLQDLEHYDAASRGLLGALAFLCRFLGSPRAYLAISAAFLVLMSAAIGPFTQQSIKTYTCQQPLLNVSASIATTRYVGFEPVVGRWHTISKHPYPNMEMMIAILEGMVGSENNSKTVPFHCPTGNCDYPTYLSLGYCSSCNDVSHDVEEQRSLTHSDPAVFDWTYAIPGKVCQLRLQEAGYPFPTRLIICYEEGDWESGAVTFTVISVCSPNFVHTEYDDIINTDEYGNEYGDNHRPRCPERPEQLSSLGDSSSLVAMSCTLELCVRDYTSRVRNGVLSETTSSLTSHIIENSASHFKVLRLPCMVDSNKYDLSNISDACRDHGVLSATVYHDGKTLIVPNTCVFRADRRVPSAISDFLQSGLFQPHGAETGGTGTCSWDMNSNSSVCNPWYLETFVRGARTNADLISSIMGNITIAITNRMRAASSVADPRDNFAPGTVTQTTVCLRVDWPWLLMPAALVLITMTLLLVVLYRARKSHLVEGQPIWKSSALAALFHGIDERSHAKGYTNGSTACASKCIQELRTREAKAEAENHKGMMSLRSMQARAERMVVRLETATKEPGGFVVITEEEDDHRVFLESSTTRNSACSPQDGRILSTAPRPSSNTAHEHSPMYLSVDLGVELTPSIHSSLGLSAHSGLEGSCERES